MKPVGLADPRTGREPHAVVQLRREDRAGQMWNLVGFQTRLRIPEQQRVFRMIPGLEAAEYLRFGSIHRNSYLNSPASLGEGLSARDDDRLFFAGQITGVEGYVESAASGLLAGINAARLARAAEAIFPPETTALGSLLRYVSDSSRKHFQPMNANFGLLPSLAVRAKSSARKEIHVRRALEDLDDWMKATGEGTAIRLAGEA
jgi:methylenetetrahydrofolate--tRNA-(uracil-5-)-methyltransferase